MTPPKNLYGEEWTMPPAMVVNTGQAEELVESSGIAEYIRHEDMQTLLDWIAQHTDPPGRPAPPDSTLKLRHLETGEIGVFYVELELQDEREGSYYITDIRRLSP